MKFYIPGGSYDSLEGVARLLLLAAKGNPARAQIALRRAIKAGVYNPVSDDQLFLAARQIQVQSLAKGKRCRDFTAIQKVAPNGWRTLWRKYQQRRPRKTLEQIARLYAPYFSDKTTPTF
jgi:hypothetical protein